MQLTMNDFGEHDMNNALIFIDVKIVPKEILL